MVNNLVNVSCFKMAANGLRLGVGGLEAHKLNYSCQSYYQQTDVSGSGFSQVDSFPNTLLVGNFGFVQQNGKGCLSDILVCARKWYQNNVALNYYIFRNYLGLALQSCLCHELHKFARIANRELVKISVIRG